MSLCDVILYWRWPPSLIQVIKPIVSSRIIRFQVEQTNNIVALAVFMFIRNISAEQTKFQYNRGSISNRNLTITLSIDIYDSGQCKVIHPSSDLHSFNIHGIRKSICTPIHVFKKIHLAFSIENWMLQRCLRRNSEVFTAFSISTLSNNDVIHGVPVYFKCRQLSGLMLKWIKIFTNYSNIVVQQ